MRSAHFLKNDKTASQDLSSGALLYLSSFAQKFKLEQVLIHFVDGSNNPLGVTETVTVSIVSAAGITYKLQEVVLVSETDFVYRPQGEQNYQAGDEVKVQCTNANTTGIAKLLVKTSEM